MCGFGSTTDLGKMDFNFSCKNRNSKVYTSLEKIVGLVTRSTEKLILHFRIFLWFIWILQASAKTHKRVKNLFMRRPLERFGGSQKYPQFAQNTLERSQASQCGPWAKGAARLGEIWRGRRRGWPGKGWSGVYGSPGLRVWPVLGSARHRRDHPAALGRCGRGTALSGEEMAGVDQQATVQALVGAWVPVWGAKQPCWGSGGGAPCSAPMATTTALLWLTRGRAVQFIAGEWEGDSRT
jgi:hypothetical protein